MPIRVKFIAKTHLSGMICVPLRVCTALNIPLFWSSSISFLAVTEIYLCVSELKPIFRLLRKLISVTKFVLIFHPQCKRRSQIIVEEWFRRKRYPMCYIMLAISSQVVVCEMNRWVWFRIRVASITCMQIISTSKKIFIKYFLSKTGENPGRILV